MRKKMLDVLAVLKNQLGKKSMKSRLGLLGFCLIFILGVVYVFSPIDSIAAPNKDKVYMIKSRYSGKYLDIPYSSFKVSEQVQLYDKHVGQLNQLFKIEPANAAGYYKIRGINSLLVFDLWGANNKDNEIVIQYTDSNTTNQQFAFEEQSDGSYKIKVRHSGKYLTIKGDSKDNEAKLVQWPYKTSGADNQSWIIEEVKNPFQNLNSYIRYKYITLGDRDTYRIIFGAKHLGFNESDATIEAELNKVISDTRPSTQKLYAIKSAYSNLYLDVYDDSTKAGANVIQWRKKSPLGLNQIFRVEPGKDPGYYKIINANSNLVFDVYGESTNKNEAIIQYYDNNKNNQQFSFHLEKGGTYRIGAKYSGMYLTVKDDSKNEGAWIVQWPFKDSGVNNQSWILEEVKNPYSHLEEFVRDRVLNARIINTDTIYNGAKGLGFSTTKAIVEELINKYLVQDGSKVFTDKTGFITTFGMLNDTVDKISFAGAHNAFSNNKDRRSSYAWDTYKTGHDLGTENHNISIKTMLEVGYRVIDLDIGDNGNGKTGSYHRYRLSGYSNLNGSNAILPKIKAFLDENPNEIVIIHLSDVYNGTIDLTKLKNHSIYRKGEDGYNKQVSNMFNDMQSTGLLGMTYNYQGNDGTEFWDRQKNMKVPGQDIEWPTIRQMLQSGKRVLFLERDTGIATDLWFSNTNNDPNRAVKENLNVSDGFLNDLQGKNKSKFINITFTDDWGASAGDLNAAKINNNGRNNYDVMKKANDAMKAKGIQKLINVLYVDYATGNKKQGGFEDVSPVDACNRANFDFNGYKWDSATVGQWYWQ